jgi:membrane protein required for colicin V production
MAWVDLFFLGLWLLSAAVGFWRGLFFEVMSLVGWVVAYVVAVWASPVVAPHVPLGTPGGALNQLTSFIATFVATLIFWALLSRLFRMLLRATPLSLVDRLLGGIFGLARGLILALAVFTVVGWTPWARSDVWVQSQVRPWLAAARDTLIPLLPGSWTRIWRQ